MSGPPRLPQVRKKWRPSLAMVVGIVLIIVMVLPLAGMAAVVMVSRSPESILASLAANAGKIWAAGVVIIAVTAMVGFLFWRLVTRPMRDLVRWTEVVASRDRMAPIAEGGFGTRELARLAESFSDMVGKLQARSEYIETFTAHVSHELKSPLTSIAGAAELMRDAGDEMDASSRARFLDNIQTDAARLSALVARMRALARAENSRGAGSAAITELVDHLRRQCEGLTISSHGDAARLPLPLEDGLVVFSHLADNAIRHGARHLTISSTDEGGQIRIAVANDGAPVPAGSRERIFEPFYTTRRESGGTGMGLAIARAMLKSHGGDIALDDSADGVGFTIVLPTTPSRRSTSSEPTKFYIQ